MKQRQWIGVGILLLLFAGCGREPQPALWKGDIFVYYLNEEETQLVSTGYTPSVSGGEAMVGELLDAMRIPVEEACITALPETVATPEITMGSNGLVTLEFDETYHTVFGVREVLLRAAVVKTICQVPEIDTVEFYVAGQPLMGTQNVPVGLMKAEDFIDTMGAETNFYQYLHTTVYYANETGDALLASDLKIPYGGSETEEETVLRQLITGPVEEGMYPVLPEDVTVLHVSTKDGICTVDFDKKFLEMRPGVTEEVVLYSVVNSLAELPGVYKIQFLVEGTQKKVYQTMNLNVAYERNLSIIEEE